MKCVYKVVRDGDGDDGVVSTIRAVIMKRWCGQSPNRKSTTQRGGAAGYRRLWRIVSREGKLLISRTLLIQADKKGQL